MSDKIQRGMRDTADSVKVNFMEEVKKQLNQMPCDKCGKVGTLELKDEAFECSNCGQQYSG